MPYASPSGCNIPTVRCPNYAVSGGRCAVHRPTTTERGYGAAHQAERAAALPGAACEVCGCTRDLKRDHRIPASMGGSHDPSNKRWLCDCPAHRHHSKLGVQSNRKPVAV